MVKQRYRVGQRVYSYQNPTKKARISHVRPGEGIYQPAYKLALKDKEGYSYSSKWISQTSIRKTKKRTHVRRHRLGKRYR